MTECAKCGDCCETIPFPVRRLYRNAAGDSWKYVNYPDPRDDEVWKSKWNHWKDENRPQAIRNWTDLNFIRTHWIPISDGDCTCDMFDSETRLCLAQDDKPPVCQGYPWYGREPYEDLISLRCSFWADIPRAKWPEGVSPIRVRIRSAAMTEIQHFRPRRYQRKRTISAEIPVAAKYVGRPTKWGNPFKITDAIELGFAKDENDGRAFVVDVFRDWLFKGDLSEWWFLNGVEQHAWMRENIKDLYGKDLVCWCPLDQPCHADVLLEAARV